MILREVGNLFLLIGKVRPGASEQDLEVGVFDWNHKANKESYSLGKKAGQLTVNQDTLSRNGSDDRTIKSERRFADYDSDVVSTAR